jgi:hypothetical protein
VSQTYRPGVGAGFTFAGDPVLTFGTTDVAPLPGDSGEGPMSEWLWWTLGGVVGAMLIATIAGEDYNGAH